MTETTRHPVDLALRAMTTTLEPTNADYEYAWNRLMEAISSPPRPDPRTRARLTWATAIALVVVIAVLVVQTASISPAEALITELAQIAGANDPLTIPDSQFAYVRIDATGLNSVDRDSLPAGVEFEHETLFWTLDYARESWIGNEGTVRLRTKYSQPTFFSPTDETAYYAAGFDEGDHVGETIVETQPETNRILDEDWPTDAVELETTIRSRVGNDDIQVLGTCLELLREPLLPQDLRAAALRMIAGLDLKLVEERADGAGTFSVEYQLEDSGPRRLTFTLDANGYVTFQELVAVDGYPDQGVPPGTVESSETYSVPVLVDNLP